MCETIPHGQRIVGAELIIRARIDSKTVLRDAKHVCERIDDAHGDRVERRAVDNGSIVCGVEPGVEEERRALAHRAAEVAADFSKQKWRLLLRIRITGVPKIA